MNQYHLKMWITDPVWSIKRVWYTLKRKRHQKRVNKALMLLRISRAEYASLRFQRSMGVSTTEWSSEDTSANEVSA